MNEELLYNQLYERTKKFGRTQFIKEIMRLERENQQLKEQPNNPLRGIFAQVNDDDLLISNGMYYAENQELKEQLQQRDEVIEKALEIVEYRLKENNNHINARMEIFHYDNLKEILTKYKGDNNE